MKTRSEKKLLIEQLKKTPIIQIACEKTRISRATFYRWRKVDKKFREKSDEALLEGAALVNDMAESQLLAAIRNQNITAIIFWLKNHHKNYRNKVELSGSISTHRTLTAEEEKMVKKALIHAGMGQKLLSNPIQK
jgi:ACT domain-containing protein